ncbi:CDP-diacylglycerol--glycerol-3-phosphate 3-phosphatidyltransferase [Sporobolomyces salmoneus]|uniref:CDP-diacylglycerol--glycerol-3-phosphate 3-phosphatidyltransferase n=1 Tax=Sporobolomyces salmoneus TaxID=183962 RepID=UPI00317BE819
MLKHGTLRQFTRRSLLAQPTRRSTSSTTTSAAVRPDQGHPAFQDLEERLEPLPCFRTRAQECVKVLYEPQEFYQRLLHKIRNAKRTIFIASLYVGKEEKELISTLHDALRRNPSLELTFLTDYFRSTRETPNPSSASLLASLSAAFPDRVDLRLFHTPDLYGWKERVVPKRFNEGWGLQHMKIYGFDDDVIMSGANLSRDYFTNRQDRYIEFSHHPPLADFFSSLVSITSSYSYRLTATDTSTQHPSITLGWPTSNPFPCAPFQKPHLIPAYVNSAAEAYNDLIKRWTEKPWRDLASPLPPFHSSSSSDSSALGNASPPPSTILSSHPSYPLQSPYDTTLRPVLQMYPFQQTQETSLVVPSIFKTANMLATAPGGGETKIDWTSGYFGLRKEYKELVLGCKAKVGIVSASPEANGFFGSKGVSKYIPPAYTQFSKDFYEELVEQAKRRKKSELGVEMREWKKDNWTYHAKGIWLTPALSNRSSTPLNASPLADANDLDQYLLSLTPLPPYLTLIGSSNYGSRSATRDLEANVLITTQSYGLRKQLEKELKAIRKDAGDVVDEKLFERKERKVGWGVRVAAKVIESML